MAPTEVSENLSLSWDAYQKSICNGLSQLQQRGEFVDMTLAADGYHVKVHQLVMSLVSPYIKDLISTTQCTHPIIFLNNISYTTLCAILEYIYTGEVLVPKNRLPDLITAGKALHIKGLREIQDNQTPDSDPTTKANPMPPKAKSISERLRNLKEKKLAGQPKVEKKRSSPVPVPMCKIYVDETHSDSAMDVQDSTIDFEDSTIDLEDPSIDIRNLPEDIQAETSAVGETELGTLNNSNHGLGQSVINLTSTDARNTHKHLLKSKLNYTVSNQGGLQTIYNRFMYQLRYISKDRKISWRCVDYNKTRCQATIFTNANEEVIDQTCRHNHSFHDKRILQKIRIGLVYKKFEEAAIKSECKKNIAIPFQKLKMQTKRQEVYK